MEPSGHAVVLIRCSPECLVFLNSWGQDWGDGGFFRVKDATVLNNMRFFDVYWLEEELTPKEKEAYKLKASHNAKKLHKEFPSVDELLFQCPKCERNSRVGDFGGSCFEAECPQCRRTFKPKNEDLVKTLYLKKM